MNYNGFVTWLIEEKKMNPRSARDAVSRLRRVLTLTNSSEISEETLQILNSSEKFNECSMFVRSQLRRALSLYCDFTKDSIGVRR